ncbi:MAG: hypothetical protein AAGG44_07480 [Planctomycetota bacterium]
MRDNMNESEAISVAQSYAVGWDVRWVATRDVTPHKAGFWPLTYVWAYSIRFDAGQADGEIHLHAKKNAIYPIDRLIVSPHESTEFLLPLWAAFPYQSRVSSLWRQGPGEVYYDKWRTWFVALPSEEQERYMNRYPAPDDDSLCFADFYEDFVVRETCPIYPQSPSSD